MTLVLDQPTLILNRNWQPIGVAPVSRSLMLVWNETAQFVDPSDFQLYTWNDWSQLKLAENEPFIQAVRQRLRVPEVVVLTRYDRLPVRSVPLSRRNLFKRDEYTCQYCGDRPGSEELTIDHVLPRSRGGVSSWANCVLACVECNKRKANRTPSEARMPLRGVPVRPKWQPSYASRLNRIESWSRFISEVYWTVELEK